MEAGGEMRRERIERLLRELENEVTRGVVEREIEPRMGMNKLLPGGPTGTVLLSFEVRPTDGREYFGEDRMPRLGVWRRVQVTPLAALIAAGLGRDCPRFSGGRYAQFERPEAKRFRLPGYSRQ